MKIKELLANKGHTVVIIGQNETVRTAIQKLVENNIGALPVTDADGRLVGIVTERDILKKCSQVKSNQELDSTRVKDIMSRNVAIGIPEDDLDYVVNIMAQKGIRHLPVMEGSKLEGMLSIRDIIEVQLEETRAHIRYLGDYISGSYS